MRVLILISREQFDNVMCNMQRSDRNDYYTNGEGCHNRRLSVTEEQIANMLPAERAFVNIRHNGLSPTMCKGYTILDNDMGACYRTSGGNVHGVYRHQPDANRPHYFMYYAFYSGRRSRVQDLVNSLFEEYRKIGTVMYSTTGPKDMRWYETLSAYLVRKGPKSAIDYFADTGVEGDHLGQEEYTALAHFTAQDPDFVSKVYAAMMEGMDPEKYILDSFRNKKIVPETMDPKTAAAWQLLPQEVQSRILRWS